MKRFRFWHNNLKCFIIPEPDTITFNSRGEIISLNPNITEIQQYVGVQDYYRCDIAEGDILSKDDKQYEVLYNNSGFCLKRLGAEYCINMPSSQECIDDKIIITGHIL
jgi:hypothetical protein